ncbi:MAG: response regulator [Alkalispirochaetaceae bacterium]
MSGERIAVVEDERLVALDIKNHLERFGYVVPRTFTRAEDLLAYIANEPPELVLMDIHLEGELDGITAAERIRRDFDIPVILLTAYADEATIERARTSRPFAYLIKPFNSRELRTSIVISIERHNLERAVRERQLLLNTVVENVGEGIFLCDQSGTVRYVNGIAASMLGVAPEELYDRKLSEVLTFSDGDSVEEALRARGYKSLLGGREEEIPVDLRVAEVPEQHKVYVLQDVREHIAHERELLNKEEQLSHARKMEAIGRLAGGIAHEFNNLLTVIMGYARLLADAAKEAEGEEPVDAGWIRRNAEGILNAASGSTSMIRQLLSFGRYEERQPRRVDLNGIIGSLDKILTRLMGERIAVNFSLSSETNSVMVDPGRIEQSLLNLVLNARDAMPDGGVLTISTRSVLFEESTTVVSGEIPPGSYVSLSVADTGEGIERGTLSRIFEPFFTTKERGSGTGLGLAAVYSTVEQAKGYLDVISEAEGGTVFTIYLPAMPGEDVEGQQESGVEVEKSVGGEGRILVIVPDQEIRQMLTQLLSSHGYTAFGTSNPGEALIVLEELTESFDLTICDFSTPLINGARLLRRFERVAPEKPSILLVDQSDPLEEAELEELSHCTPLNKPFGPQRILQLVEKALLE